MSCPIHPVEPKASPACPGCLSALRRENAGLRSALEVNEAFERVRPAVAWFAGQMEAKLRENDAKSDWLEMPPDDLFALLLDESDELSGELMQWAGWSGAGRGSSPERIVREAADVANFALMIADHVGRRIGSGRKGGGE